MAKLLVAVLASLLTVGCFAERFQNDAHLGDTKATTKLYGPTSKLTCKKIFQALIKKQINSEDCPWVKQPSGNGKQALYTSVTITGENSWMPIVVKAVTEKGSKKFVIFTGRHGSMVHAVVTGLNAKNPSMTAPINNVRVDQEVWEPSFVDEDKKRVKQMMAEKQMKKIKGLKLTLVDVNPHKTNHVKWLKEETKKHLKAGSNVIWAWCYSLYAPIEGDIGAPKMVTDSHALVTQNKKISVIVTENYKSWFK